MLLPVDQILGEQEFPPKSVEWNYPLSYSVVDNVAPAFKQLLEASYSSTKMVCPEADKKKYNANWWSQRKNLDICLTKFLKQPVFGILNLYLICCIILLVLCGFIVNSNYVNTDIWKIHGCDHGLACLLLGKRLDVDPFSMILPELINELKHHFHIEANESLISVVLHGSNSVCEAEACISQMTSYKGYFGYGACCADENFRAFSPAFPKETLTIPESVHKLIPEEIVKSEQQPDRDAMILASDSDVQRWLPQDHRSREQQEARWWWQASRQQLQEHVQLRRQALGQ